MALSKKLPNPSNSKQSQAHGLDTFNLISLGKIKCFEIKTIFFSFSSAIRNDVFKPIDSPQN